MSRYALVRSSDGLVRNVVELDGVGDYAPPSGHAVYVDAEGRAQIGGSWNGAAFLPAPAAPAPDPAIAADRNLVAAFLAAASGTATAAQRDDVVKALVRYLRRNGQEI